MLLVSIGMVRQDAICEIICSTGPKAPSHGAFLAKRLAENSARKQFEACEWHVMLLASERCVFTIKWVSIVKAKSTLQPAPIVGN